jgi:hypothetical protein
MSNLRQYDAVEIKKAYGNEWDTGYWILKIEESGSCLVSRTYQGDHGITQLSFPTRCSPTELRKPTTPPKLKVTGGIYKAENFLQEYGACMVRALYKEEELGRDREASEQKADRAATKSRATQGAAGKA